MPIVSPLTAVNTDHRDTERFNVDNIVIIGEKAAPASVSDQLQTIHVGVDRQSRRGEHLFQRLVNDPRICAIFGQREISVQQDFLSHIIEILGTELALIESTGQTANQTRSRESSLVVSSHRFSVQYILITLNPFHGAVRQLIAELDYYRGIFIDIGINAGRVIGVIIVFIIQDHKLHGFLRQSATQRVNIVSLSGGNNVAVQEGLFNAIQYPFQARSAIRKTATEGYGQLVDLGGSGINDHLGSCHGNGHAILHRTVQIEVNGHRQRPFLIASVKCQSHAGESARFGELTGQHSRRRKFSVLVTHKTRHKAVFHGTGRRDDDRIAVQCPPV